VFIFPYKQPRLEAFVRLAHAIIVFPGGVGTVEETLYLLSILMHPDNSEALTLVFAGPPSCNTYFEELERFLNDSLGEDVKRFYRVFLGSPEEVGKSIKMGIGEVHARRRRSQQAYYFNWELNISADLQQPFIPTHDNMAALELRVDAPAHKLSSALRCVFSGLVAGNVKAFGIEQVRAHGPYKLSGDKQLLSSMDRLLRVLVKEGRMKLGEDAQDYQPCYQMID
jgi:hypothetical protein